MATVNSVELISTRFTSSSSVPLLEKLKRGFDPTGVFTKRRKEGTLDTENKNGCFRWAWLMKWEIWKLRNHIVHTEGIKSVNHSNRKTVSSHHNNIDSFLVWSEPFYCLPKTCSQTCQPAPLFYEMFRTRSSLLQILLRRNQRQTPLTTQLLCWRTKEASSPAKERIPY